MKKKSFMLNSLSFRTLDARNLRSQISKFSLVTLVFLFMKANAFTAALFLTNFVGNVADFGVFEYALSIGLIAAIPLNFGMQGAYPYFNLKLKKEGFKSVFYGHALLLSVVLLLVLAIDFSAGNYLSPSMALAILIAGIYMNQIGLSSIFKSHDRVITAAVLDGGMFLVLNIYNLFLFTSESVFQHKYLKVVFFGYFLLLIGSNGFYLLKFRTDFSWKNYFSALSFGKNIIISTFLIICLTGSARIFIEYFLGVEAVGFYGFYFRLAAAVVLVHQVVNIAFFKKMYQANPIALDKYFSIFAASLLVIGLVLWQVVPVLFEDLFVLFSEAGPEHQKMHLLLTFQMIFWIALALNENIINRENLARKINGRFALIFGGMLFTIYVLNAFEMLNLPSFVFVNSVALFLGLEMQIDLLRSKEIDFSKLKITGRGVMILAVICFLFLKI